MRNATIEAIKDSLFRGLVSGEERDIRRNKLPMNSVVSRERLVDELVKAVAAGLAAAAFFTLHTSAALKKFLHFLNGARGTTEPACAFGYGVASSARQNNI